MATPAGWEAFTESATRRSELVFLWTSRTVDLAHQVEQALGGRPDWLDQVLKNFVASSFWCSRGFPLEALLKNLHQFAPRAPRPPRREPVQLEICRHEDMQLELEPADGGRVERWSCSCGHVESEFVTFEQLEAAEKFKSMLALSGVAPAAG